MIATLKQVFHRGQRTREVCECRHCGTTVERASGGCPTCDSDEIVCYDF